MPCLTSRLPAKVLIKIQWISLKETAWSKLKVNTMSKLKEYTISKLKENTMGGGGAVLRFFVTS